ncbi:uncharacterized protein Z518_09858 [Rhinocladiella mackenziei CBS 650.93]|uniref:Major facilitator superfamily (MFS) profile domain-containing protein n=1 Tax=Rhinocladiella mackenziei CBS 650.93 TaxID=1442369 RepID=A0A0D2GR45_9EURO|nr:uncharacterized protein Z518_09858 [Rhinocladiella mackenziei CBS 650.93]KIX00793.1 hypothetical protein Z518_09858 [Rhinocladiella mackenziei CBS 650.93]
MTLDRLPPGTQRIEDKTGEKILLAPQPNADPNQPLNWSKFRKALHMTLLCFYALMVFAILCVAVPLWQDFNTELGMSYAVLNDGYATNMATLSVGCIIFVPIALRIGRRPVYILTALVMLAAAIWQAKMRTVGDMIGANAISGLAGAVNEAIFQVTVSDLFFVHQRGTMNGIYLVVVIIGNYLGPVAAGYVAVSQDWRWCFWYCTIFMSIVTLAMIFLLEETKYTPLVLEGREVVVSTTQKDHLTKVTSSIKSALGSISVDATEAANNDRRRLVEIDASIPMNSYWKRHRFFSLDKQTTTERRRLWMHFYQPFQILFTFPAVMFAALQYGFLIAMLAILAVTQATLYPFPPYNFSPIGVGNVCSLKPCPVLSETIIFFILPWLSTKLFLAKIVHIYSFMKRKVQGTLYILKHYICHFSNLSDQNPTSLNPSYDQIADTSFGGTTDELAPCYWCCAWQLIWRSSERLFHLTSREEEEWYIRA